MANSKRGEVGFKVGGEGFAYKLSTNAMCTFQDHTGESILTALGDMDGGAALDFRKVRALFWVGILPEVTEEEAGDMIDELGFEKALGVVTDGATAAFPSAEPEAAEEGNAPKRPAAKT